MSYDRYDNRRTTRDPRSRFYGDRDRSDRFERDTRDERGFFERAGDEVASWFGDDDAERRRQMDMRRERFEDESRSSWSGDDEHGRFDRQARYRDEGYRRPYTGRLGGMRNPGSDSGYRPYAGDYGRSGMDSGDVRSGRYSASAPATGSASDPHYSEWRRRQMDELDRDYDDFRRENQSRFDSEFSSWRNTRQTKRQMLGQVREHMNVVGSDDEHLGTVDKVRGDRIILTKGDSDDGAHHAINCSMVDRIEGDKVVLDKSADDARKHFSNENRDRALFERDDQREPGAHILNRSFSGTY